MGEICKSGSIEDGRGSLGHAATLRFPSPLIEPNVRISRIRLSDWTASAASEAYDPKADSVPVRNTCVARRVGSWPVTLCAAIFA